MEAVKSPRLTATENQVHKKEAKIIQLYPFQQPRQKEITMLVNALWGVAASSFWFNKMFTAEEVDHYKQLIGEHFFNGRDARVNFKELVERLCLAKRYVARKSGRYISKPQDYLNVHYPSGLSGTAAWLACIEEIRKEVPEHNKGITTFAKALLSFIENPSKINYHEGRKQLTEQNQFDLLQIYHHVIIHIQYHM